MWVKGVQRRDDLSDTLTSSQLALSAASPAFRGYLSDIDCRWSVISASVDDRTEEERGLKVTDITSLSPPLFFIVFLSLSPSPCLKTSLSYLNLAMIQ